MANKLVGGILGTRAGEAGLSLIFDAGERPTSVQIESLLASESLAGPTARISHRAEDCTGMLELLASGLTFDLSGLSPAEPAAILGPDFRFGAVPEPATSNLEAIRFSPGPHVAGGAAMMPVVRIMTGLAAGLAMSLPVKAVCWHPAGSWMEPNYFAKVIVNWLSGGAFPALGLTAIEPLDGGGMQSQGLAFFTGQEIRVEAPVGEAPSDTAKLALRVIDYLVESGRVDSLQELKGPSGELLLAEPSRDKRVVKVWRGSA